MLSLVNFATVYICARAIFLCWLYAF